MIVLSLTEEDRSLLLPLTPIQRDRVILALLAGGEAEENWGEIEQGILESIRRRGPKRVVKDFLIKFTKKPQKSARSTFMLLTLRRVGLLFPG